jgi:hypothetical protein
LFFAYLLGLPWVGQALDQALSFAGPGAGTGRTHQNQGSGLHYMTL